MFIPLGILLLKSEPLSFGEGMVMLVIVMVVIIAGTAIGGYIFVRVLAGIINQRRDSWELSARELGMSIDHPSGGLNKDMMGTREGRSVRVTRYSVPKGEHSADHYVAVEVSMQMPIAFSFEIKRPEMFYQHVASFFSEDTTIGHEPFAKAFTVETSDTPSLMELLNVEMLDGENSNLIGDLMAARKKYNRVKATESSVSLSSLMADLTDASPIEPTLKKAINIAERFEKAAGTVSSGGRQ